MSLHRSSTPFDVLPLGFPIFSFTRTHPTVSIRQRRWMIVFATIFRAPSSLLHLDYPSRSRYVLHHLCMLHGSVIVTESAGSYRTEAKVVANELKAQEMAGTVKDPHAIRVLEVCDLLQERKWANLV